MGSKPTFGTALSIAALFAASAASADLVPGGLQGALEEEERVIKRVQTPPPNRPARQRRPEERRPGRGLDLAPAAPVERVEREAPRRRIRVPRGNPDAGAAIRLNMARREKEESTPRRQYWHRSGTTRYCHYYDGHWHWYGFYHGPHFYWTRYHLHWWWWWDARHARWVYWWDGFWWWPGPDGMMFVYVDGRYHPYSPASAVSDEHAPPPGAPGTMNKSPDGKRLVRVTLDGSAYLYKKRLWRGPKYMKHLDSGVKLASFTGGKGGSPLRIVLEKKNGSLALFDADGKAVAAAKDASPPSAAPEEIPPPPEYAP